MKDICILKSWPILNAKFISMKKQSALFFALPGYYIEARSPYLEYQRYFLTLDRRTQIYLSAVCLTSYELI